MAVYLIRDVMIKYFLTNIYSFTDTYELTEDRTIDAFIIRNILFFITIYGQHVNPG
jgi:hypothetical protein